MAVMSRTTQYALYALQYLHKSNSKQYVLARSISEHDSVPSNYLSKVMRTLVRAGILGSARGPSGGFRLVRPLETVTLLEVRELFEGPWNDRACVLGLGRCDGDAPCAAHHNWQPVASMIENYLANTSVADIVAEPKAVAPAA